MKNGISLPRALVSVALGVTIVLTGTVQLGWREWWQIVAGIIIGVIAGMFLADHRRAISVLKGVAVWTKDQATEIPEIKKVISESRKATISEIGFVFNGLWVFLLIQCVFILIAYLDKSGFSVLNFVFWIFFSITVPFGVGIWASEGIDQMRVDRGGRVSDSPQKRGKKKTYHWEYGKVGLFEAIFHGPLRLIKCLMAVIASIGIVLFKFVVIIFFLLEIFSKEINKQRLMRVVAAIVVGGLLGTWQNSWSWGLSGPVFYLLSPVVKRIFMFVYDLIDFEFTDTWESVWEFGKLTND